MSLEKDALQAINLGADVNAQIVDTKPRNTDFNDAALLTLSKTLSETSGDDEQEDAAAADLTSNDPKTSTAQPIPIVPMSIQQPENTNDSDHNETYDVSTPLTAKKTNESPKNSSSPHNGGPYDMRPIAASTLKVSGSYSGAHSPSQTLNAPKSPFSVSARSPRSPQPLSPEMSQHLDTLSQKERDYIGHILKCCDEADGFDLYQLMAFRSNTKDSWKDYAYYALSVIKAGFCAATQLLGMVIIMIDFVRNGLEVKGFDIDDEDAWETICPTWNAEGAWYEAIYRLQSKILAFLFSSFLGFFCYDQLMGVEMGMYRKMKYAKNLKWINAKWLRIGFSVNVIASIIAVYGSFLVVFFSDDSLDMVLNSVALFFIVELDDLLVKPSDYDRIAQYIRDFNYEKEKEKFEDDGEGRCMAFRTCCGLCCGHFMRFSAWLYTLPFEILRYVTVVACFVMPFFIVTCY